MRTDIITPEEVLSSRKITEEERLSRIPDVVIKTINAAIPKHFRGDSACILVNDLLGTLITVCPKYTPEEIRSSRWLEVAGLYAEVGWTVTYVHQGDQLASIIFSTKPKTHNNVFRDEKYHPFT